MNTEGAVATCTPSFSTLSGVERSVRDKQEQDLMISGFAEDQQETMPELCTCDLVHNRDHCRGIRKF